MSLESQESAPPIRVRADLTAKGKARSHFCIVISKRAESGSASLDDAKGSEDDCHDRHRDHPPPRRHPEAGHGAIRLKLAVCIFELPQPSFGIGVLDGTQPSRVASIGDDRTAETANLVG